MIRPNSIMIARRTLGMICTRNIASSRVMQAKIVEMVPALGESITEGSISRWVKNIGEKVAVDDVIVIIETDKVTVDIKSTNAGVLTGQLATDTVVVGQPLFELDSDGVASTVVAATPASSGTAPVLAAASSAAPSGSDHHRSRTPLIKFLGKRSLLKNVGHAAAPFPTKPSPAVKVVGAPAPKPVKEGTGVDFATLQGGAWYGRPRISEAEMNAIESGGAY